MTKFGKNLLKIFLCSKLTQLFFSISQCFVNTSLASRNCVCENETISE